MIYEMTIQFRVSDFDRGLAWYRSLRGKGPDFAPHDGFAEWELIPGCWLQVAEGTPIEGNGPLRLGVTDIEMERNRVVTELNVAPFELYSRTEVPVRWGPVGEPVGFFRTLE